MQLEVSTQNLQKILKERFGLDRFRLGQQEVIASVLSGRDTLAVMPTGSGKSLCYQLSACFRPGIVVVISPLISLMEDQVRSLKQLGIAAGFVHSGQTFEEKREMFRQLREQPQFLLYVAPERIQKDGFARWIQNQQISLFAIDEAHCVSQWGPDFRKDYYQLSLLREYKPEVPILALTATATPPVLNDIKNQLKLRDPAKHIYGFYRPNLYCQVEGCEDDEYKFAAVRKALEQVPAGRALIYCGTRKQTEAVCESLNESFAGVGSYHAGLSTEVRSQIQKQYERGDLRILAATNAFGMGIDHPDVRLVVHFQMPANIESYYQEIGRAGRDGNPSTCLLLYSKRDKGLHSYFIQKAQAETEPRIINQRWRALDTIVQFAEGGECRHGGILTYFRDSFRIKNCGHCDICAPESDLRIDPPERAVKKLKKSAKRSGLPKSIDSVEVPLTEAEQLRVEMLRIWRKEYADSKDIPAFIVFSNKTLEDLARRNPSTQDQLRFVYGFGPHKVEHLGKLILDRLAELPPT